MFNWKEFEQTKNILSQVSSYREVAGQHHVTIRPTELRRWVQILSEDLGYLTLVDVAGVDNSAANQDYKLELVYLFLNMGTHQRLNVHVKFNSGEIVPSIKDIFPVSDWMEREQAEALQINFDIFRPSLLLPEGQQVFPLLKNADIKGSYPIEEEKPLPSIARNPNKSEAPYPEESYIWKRFDILHPITAGHFEWLVCFDPNHVVDSRLNIGFYHQGLEKMLESMNWIHGLQLVDKINLSSAPTYSMAWAMNLEELLRIKVPERAQAIRIILLELARIAEHLSVMFEVVKSINMSEAKLFINFREKVYELIEKYSGRRQGVGSVKVGGVSEDLPHGWIVEYQAVFELFTKFFKVLNRSLVLNKQFRSVLSGGEVNAQTALLWGISGPAMRAAGLNFDLRKSRPLYFYQDIDFDVPVGIHGTSYDRFLIRFEEIFQSFRIITQVIDNLPLGEFMNPDYAQDFVTLHQHLSREVPLRTWNYTSLESPNGEVGFFISYGDDLIPHRVKIKTPSFVLAQALKQFTQGLTEQQLRACLMSLGIRRLEMDR